MACLSLLSLVTSLVAATNGPSDGPRVVVIGGGIGGAAFSYYLHKALPDAVVTLLESSERIGGRLRHTVMHNQTVELGGDAWSTAANAYVVELAKEVGLGDRQPRTRSRRQLDPVNLRLGTWTGSRLVDVEHVIETNLMSDLKGMVMESGFLGRLKLNYAERGAGTAFDDIPGFLRYGSLDEYTRESASDWYRRKGVSSELQDLLLEPLSRVIYDQDLNASHAFSSLVAVTSVLGAASFNPGNEP